MPDEPNENPLIAKFETRFKELEDKIESASGKDDLKRIAEDLESLKSKMVSLAPSQDVTDLKERLSHLQDDVRSIGGDSLPKNATSNTRGRKTVEVTEEKKIPLTLLDMD